MISPFLKVSSLLALLMTLAACGSTQSEIPSDALATANSLVTPLGWSAGPALPAARSQTASVTLADGSILVLGGSSVTPPTSVLKLAPGATTWTTLGNLDHVRVAPGAGVLSNSSIAVFGGKDRNVDKTSTLFIPSSNCTAGLPSMNSARFQAAWASAASGDVFAIGGQDDLGNVLALSESNAGAKWLAATALPTARVGAAATFAGSELYVFGGATTLGAVSSSVFHSTPFGIDRSWNAVAAMPVAVRNAAIVLGKNNLVYLLGGSNGSAPVNTVQVYNTLSNTWSTENPLPVALTGASAAIDTAGNVLVIGGTDASNTNLSTVWKTPQGGAVPVFTSTPVTSAIVGQPFTYQVSASGKPAPTFSLVASPAGMTLSATGLISWTPTALQLGAQTVTIQASSVEAQVNQSFSLTVLAPAPTVPVGLVASDITETSFTLSWSASSAVVGALSYEVCEISRNACAPIQTSALSLNITGLKVGTTHNFSVSAVSSSGVKSAPSNILTITTLQPAAPTNVVVTNTTQTTVSFSWTASVGAVPIVGYRVIDYDSITTIGVPTFRVDNITGTSATVNNLLPNSRHNLQVVAFDAAGNNSVSPSTNIVTTYSVPSLFHVGAFAPYAEQIVGIVGEKLMVISALSHQTFGSDYIISTAGLPKPTLSVLVGAAGLSVDSATGLVSLSPVNAAPGTYSATIRGTNSEGSSDFTFDYTIYAAGTDLLPPTGVLTSSVTNITSTGLDIAWDAATDNYGVAGYNVYAQPVGVRASPIGPKIKVGTTTAVTTNLTVTELSPATQYSLTIEAFDAAGNIGGTSPGYNWTLP